jgi:hypothetical protein
VPFLSHGLCEFGVSISNFLSWNRALRLARSVACALEGFAKSKFSIDADEEIAPSMQERVFSTVIGETEADDSHPEWSIGIDLG